LSKFIFILDNPDCSNEVAGVVGEQFNKTLISAEFRACVNLTDKGVIDFCEGLSGLKHMKDPKEEDYRRYINRL